MENLQLVYSNLSVKPDNSFFFFKVKPYLSGCTLAWAD